MKTINETSQENCIDIRFNLTYSILILVASLCIAVVGYLAEGNDRILKYLMYLMALLSFIQGVYAISGGKFIRYDPGAKRIKFYGIGI